LRAGRTALGHVDDPWTGPDDRLEEVQLVYVVGDVHASVFDFAYGAAARVRDKRRVRVKEHLA
jgi:hypothetical protein